MLQPLCRRTWAPRGRTPVMANWDRHDRVTAIAALVLSPQRRRIRLFFQLLDHNARAEDFQHFLKELHREIPHKLIVIWDRLGAHRKAARLLVEQNTSWLDVEYLPAYAPELNPVEHVWNHAKWGALANWAAEDQDDLWCRVAEELNDQYFHQRLLRAHFRWAGLNIDESLSWRRPQ